MRFDLDIVIMNNINVYNRGYEPAVTSKKGNKISESGIREERGLKHD